MAQKENEHIIRQSTGNADTDDVKVYKKEELLQFRNSWGNISSSFFIEPIWWMFVTWLPTFLKEQFSFDIKQVGAFGWVPYLFAAIGGLSGGFYSSALVRKGMRSEKARKNAITIGCICMLVSLAAIAFYLT